MTDRFMWCGDDAGYDEPETSMDRGDVCLYSADPNWPTVQRPIGFMRHKPRVRVKAWMQPIVEGEK